MNRKSAAVLVLALAAASAAYACPPVPALSSSDAARIDASSKPNPGEPSLSEIRAATAKYRDVNVALAEGYLRDPGNMCDTAEMMGKPKKLGAMGIHFFRPDMLGISGPPNPRVDGNGTHTDFLKPSILIYEPQADGSLELIAVENLVFAKAWKEKSGGDTAPTFHGVAYDTMIDDPKTKVDEAHNFEPHHDRHIWLYRENPNGIFAQYNPRVSCAHHKGGTHAAHAGQRDSVHKAGHKHKH